MNTRHNLNRLAYFVATVEAGTITSAAELLGVSKAVVSKQLQLLEEDVGTQLLLRSTRRMQPTDAGLAFYEAGKVAIMQADHAFERVMDQENEPHGRLRVTAPVDYGMSRIAPFLMHYSKVYPKVEFEFVMSDATQDLIAERFDMAFRIGWLPDSANRARKLRDFDEVLVCTPQTAVAFAPDVPSDLTAIPFIANTAIAGKDSWDFTRGDVQQSIALGTKIVMNVTMALREAVAVSTAFTILPDFLVESDIASGRLVRLLPEWKLRTGGVYTVTSPSHVRSSALRTFLDMAHLELGYAAGRNRTK